MVVQIVAQAVDKNANKTSVRNFFVSHEGKKNLVVEVGPTLQSVDYNSFLDREALIPFCLLI